MFAKHTGNDLADAGGVGAQDCVVAVLRDVEHAQSARSSADGELSAVQRDADVGHHALVLRFQQEVGEVQRPQTQLVVLCAGHSIPTYTCQTHRKIIRTKATHLETISQQQRLPRVHGERADGAGVQLVGADDLVGLTADA